MPYLSGEPGTVCHDPLMHHTNGGHIIGLGNTEPWKRKVDPYDATSD